MLTEKAIEEPFLERELWSPDGRILTLRLHPGRLKSGLRARELMGPILSTGDDVFLAIDGRSVKQWKVGPADEAGPVISAWKMTAVRHDSLEPLIVSFDGPIDGRDTDYLAIADADGRRVAGRTRLTAGESAWTFTPDAPWRSGTYKLVVRGTLEDPSGNRLGGRFETPVDSPPDPVADAEVPSLYRGRAAEPLDNLLLTAAKPALSRLRERRRRALLATWIGIARH